MTIGLTLMLVCNIYFRYVISSRPIVAWLLRLLVSLNALNLVFIAYIATVPDGAAKGEQY
jgi:hypothetical protein